MALPDFIKDAYTTALAHDELVSEVASETPAKGKWRGVSGVQWSRVWCIRPQARRYSLRWTAMSARARLLLSAVLA